MIDARRYTSTIPEFGAHLELFLSSCDVCEDEPRLTTYDEALVTPAVGARGYPPYRGGAFSRDQELITDAALWRQGRLMSPAEVEPATASGGVGLYLGWLFVPYGHALLESLARCWALNRVKYDALVFHAPRIAEIPAHILSMLTGMGVDPEKIQLVTEATRYAQLHVPSPLFEIRHFAYRQLRQVYATMPGPPVPSEGPAYISRSRLRWGKRTVVGEAILEEILAGEGFRIVHPQTLSIADQVSAFRSHNTYVGMIGSAMHNLVFSAPGARAIYFGHDQPNFNYLLCDEIADARGHYVKCCDVVGLPVLRSSILRLNLHSALESLRGQGLIRGTYDLAEPQRRIDEEIEALVGGRAPSSVPP